MRDPQSKLHHISYAMHYYAAFKPPHLTFSLPTPNPPSPVGPIGDRKEVHEVNQLVIHLHLVSQAMVEIPGGTWWTCINGMSFMMKINVGCLNMFKVSI